MSSSQIETRLGRKEEGVSQDREGGAAGPANEGLLKSRVFWGGALIGWLLLMPQLSLYALYLQATWPFGNAISGAKELRIEFGLLSIAAALSIFSGFFVAVFLFLMKAVWWKRLLTLIGYLASHLLATKVVLTVGGLVSEVRMASDLPGGDFSTASIEGGLNYLGPLIGSVSLLPAIIVQVMCGWQIAQPSKKDERPQVSLARLFESVALCTVVTAVSYSLSGLVPGAKLYVGLESFGCIAVLSITSLSSLSLMWLMMASTSMFAKTLNIVVLLCVPSGAYFAIIGASLAITSWKMSIQDASLMGFACALACCVAEVCIAVCWWLARQTGYRLST